MTDDDWVDYVEPLGDPVKSGTSAWPGKGQGVFLRYGEMVQVGDRWIASLFNPLTGMGRLVFVDPPRTDIPLSEGE